METTINACMSKNTVLSAFHGRISVNLIKDARTEFLLVGRTLTCMTRMEAMMTVSAAKS